ncbi:hypothetical protein GIB67_027385 [Kingdonia uniflora]|uniref:C2 domain-containing protein n=1 Tax=Kingdonia uniflora TaxID=39325 RepID=A0A7J7MFL5_9MAGN|nr:hypothetical protein GIB67_027385 [Kingdonia uniflora]
MASFRPPPPKPFDLHVTIISAKHLKNVNWRHGDLKPYAIFWLDPDRRLSTKPDDSGSTHPVWNEHFTLPINPQQPLHDLLLTLEIFHSKPSETPKPLVGTIEFPIKDLFESQNSSIVKTIELRRPSGRPQGKIRLKLVIRERPMPSTPQSEYQYAPSRSSYYQSNPLTSSFGGEYRGGGYSPAPYTSSTQPPPPAPGSYYEGYSDPYSNYVQPPPPQFFERASSYGGGPSGPSAPVDYTLYEQKQKPKGNKMGLGAGLAIGAVAGVLGGLALEEGLKYEEDKIADRVEDDEASRDGDYPDYPDY